MARHHVAQGFKSGLWVAFAVQCRTGARFELLEALILATAKIRLLVVAKGLPVPLIG
ncbi:MAG: hypothetical protein AAF737_08510 [Pseudomonadota bacterium]